MRLLNVINNSMVMSLSKLVLVMEKEDLPASIHRVSKGHRITKGWK